MKNKSFTLIELLVVIVIIGILAGVIIVSVSSSINKANFAKAQAFSNTVQNELLGDLVSEWTFDIASNPEEDTWGNNDGTVYGATYKAKASGECVYGGCYEFDGTDDYIITNDTATLLLSQFTTSVWVKFDVVQDYKGVVELLGNPGYPSRIMTFPGSTIRFHPFYNSTNTNDFVSTSFLTNEWLYFVGTFDGAIGKFYKNGNYIGSTTLTTPMIYSTTTHFTIGMDSGDSSRMIDGLIDDVRIHNKTLSLSQIKQQYVAGLDSLLSNGNISKEEYNERLNNLALEGS